MAKAPKQQRDEGEPIGFVNGELKTYKPGEKIPGPMIIDEDGNEMPADEYLAKHGEKDESNAPAEESGED